MPKIIKRKGHTEKFDESKCEAVADAVTKKIRQFVKNKKVVDSSEIRKRVESELKKEEEELAFFYEHHLPNLKQL